MNLIVRALLLCGLVALLVACQQPSGQGESTRPSPQVSPGGAVMPFGVPDSETEWKKKLTADQFRVLRLKGTERAWTGDYLNNKHTGDYQCVGCGNLLFKSDAKFDSGTGWPSFWEAASQSNVELIEDNSLWMKRVEVVCSKCKGHLGHVFDDGPQPSGKRYCINSVCLKFQEEKSSGPGSTPSP